MKIIDILNKHNDCDTFSLTTLADEVKLSEEELDSAYKEIEEYHYNQLKKLHSKFKGQPEFDSLYKEIKEEVSHFASKHSYELLKEFGFFDNRAICDYVGVDTKYDEPTELYWHMYHNLGGDLDCKNLCKDYYGEKDPLDIDPVLKNNLINYKVGFISHCTESGDLQITYFFKLNEETKEYLLKYKDLYSFTELEDLALYKNNEIKMSSCTHEMYYDEF